MINHFNIRVYGLLFNESNELLVADEFCLGQFMTKFPGGGLEFGEGLIDGLKREFREELGIEIKDIKHFYTTDFFQVSAFNPSGQLISVYYTVKTENLKSIQTVKDKYESLSEIEDSQVFRWINMDVLSKEFLTWPVDQHVVGLLKSKV